MDSTASESTLRTLFHRDCVVCPPTTPSCPPNCGRDEICTQISATCTQCSYTTCIKRPASMAPPPSKGPNVGAIAGGIVGGVAVIAIATFLIWRFFIKNRRQHFVEEYEDDEDGPEKHNSGYMPSRGARASTHTMGSVASSALTRASNVIQIAFIPGITDRSGDPHAPPVPPIPIPTNSSPYSDNERDHYFHPGDLRDSTYTATTDASSEFRHSITPSLARESVASTIYHINQQPAQTMLRGRANVVSVKTSSPAETPSIPAVPTIDYDKYKTGESSKAATKTTGDADEVRGAIEQATRRASRPPHGGLGFAREQNPFTDGNAI